MAAGLIEMNTLIVSSTINWRKVGDAGRTRLHLGAKMLK
jgi:hypothetical protein